MSPEAQGPLNQTSPPWSGRLQSKLDTTGETSKSPPPAPTSQGSSAPTLLSPAPHHHLLILELPQAQLCRLQGQGAPVLYTLDSPDTTKALTPDGPAVEGRVGIHPGNLGQAQPPPPAPQPSHGPQAGGSSDRSSWPRDGEARATARQTNEVPSPARPGISKAALVARALQRMPHHLKARPRPLPAPWLTKAKAWHLWASPPEAQRPSPAPLGQNGCDPHGKSGTWAQDSPPTWPKMGVGPGPGQVAMATAQTPLSLTRCPAVARNMRLWELRPWPTVGRKVGAGGSPGCSSQPLIPGYPSHGRAAAPAQPGLLRTRPHSLPLASGGGAQESLVVQMYLRPPENCRMAPA